MSDADSFGETLPMSLELTGIHHLTAITATAAANKRFYTDTLGLRLVKKTVNQDDTSAYHLFYADGMASPGSDLTFFDWPVGRERRGTHAITRTGLRVAGGQSLEWWARRIADAGLVHAPIAEFDGRASLLFEDPEGQRLCLIDDGGTGEALGKLLLGHLLGRVARHDVGDLVAQDAGQLALGLQAGQQTVAPWRRLPGPRPPARAPPARHALPSPRPKLAAARGGAGRSRGCWGSSPRC